MADFDLFYKIIVVGDHCCGKTNIISKYATDNFNLSSVPTIGIDFAIKNVIYHKKRIRMELWDSAGQEKYRSLTSVYYRNATAIIIVFDLTNRESFNNIEKWVNEICLYSEIPIIMVIGNKADLKDLRVIPSSIAKEYCQKYNFPYVETSAKDGSNIDIAFALLLKNIFKKSNLANLIDNKEKIILEIKPNDEMVIQAKDEDHDNYCEC